MERGEIAEGTFQLVLPLTLQNVPNQASEGRTMRSQWLGRVLDTNLGSSSPLLLTRPVGGVEVMEVGRTLHTSLLPGDPSESG